MSKLLKLFIGVDLVLILVILGFLFFGSRLGLSRTPTEKTPNGQPSVQQSTGEISTEGGNNVQVEGTINEIGSESLKIRSEDGQVSSYILPSEFFYLCASKDSGVFNNMKSSDATSIEPSYLIKLEELGLKVKVGEKVHLFIFEAPDEKIYVKGLASLDCT